VADRQTAVSIVVLLALLACFCGILQQLTRILLGKRARENPPEPVGRGDGAPAMAFMLGTLLVFSLWLPAPLWNLMTGAGKIIGGMKDVL
jgi:hypothetical protein